MITVEFSIQKVERKVGVYASEPETILSVAFVRDTLLEALAAIKYQLELLDGELLDGKDG